MTVPFLHTMFRQSCCNLLSIPKQRVRQWLNSIEAVITDADGVLWQFDRPIEGSVDTLNALRAMGKRVFICSNNSRICRNLMCEKANKMGILISPNEVINAAYAGALYLSSKHFDKKVYIVGRAGIEDELKIAGIKSIRVEKEPMEVEISTYVKELSLEDDVGCVIVGEDDFFSVAKIIKAATYLMDPKCQFLAASRDGGYTAGGNYLVPAAGPIVAAVKDCSYRKPLTLGKPNPLMAAELIKNGIVKPETTLMIGDTLHTDMLFGYNCGFQTLFICCTGVSNLDDVRKAQEADDERKHKMVPDIYLPRLSDLLNFLPFKKC